MGEIKSPKHFAFALLIFVLGCTVRPQDYTGTVTTEMCVTGRHASAMPVSECVRICHKQGSPYVLVAGKKTYQLAGNLGLLDTYGGAEASVYGSRRSNTIYVDSISAAKH